MLPKRLIVAFLLLPHLALAQNAPNLDSLVEVFNQSTIDSVKLDLLDKIVEEYSFVDLEKTVEYVDKLAPLATQLNRPSAIVDGYINLGWAYMDQGHFDSTIQIFEKAHQIAVGEKLAQEEFNALYALAAAYSENGQFSQSIEYYKQAVAKGNLPNNRSRWAKSIENLGFNYRLNGEYPQAIKAYRRSLAVQEELQDMGKVMNLHLYLGHTFDNMGELDSALAAYDTGRKVAIEEKDSMGIANGLSMLGNIYNKKAQLQKALFYKMESVRLYEKLNDEYSLGAGYYNLGVFFKKQGEYEKALNFNEKALKQFVQIDDAYTIAVVRQNLGDLHLLQGEVEKAMPYLQSSSQAFKDLNRKQTFASSCAQLAQAYSMLGQYDSAKLLLETAYELHQEVQAQKEVVNTQCQLAEVESKLGNHNRALRLVSQALSTAQEKGYPDYVMKASGILAKVQEAKGNYKASYQAHLLFKAMTDSLRDEDKIREITRLEDSFNFNQEKDSIAFAQAQERLQFEQEAERQEAEQRITYLGLGLSLLLLAGSIFFFVDKQKSNLRLAQANGSLEEANEELKVANEEIQATQEETLALNDSLQETLSVVQKQKEDITDSINYAQRIQAAILPSVKRLQETLPEHFVFFKPRDIVSGDFYWLSSLGESSEKVVFAAVDCTGHGVPGAFMSMVGNDMLNHIVNERQVTVAGEILTQLHLEIRRVLNQSETNNQDGMDMSLIVWDRKEGKVNFSGAKNPLVYVKGGEVHRMRGDKMPIGGQQRELQRVFQTQSITIDEPLTCYLFSDGFQDQFGGADDRKYMSKRFREFLFNIHQLPMEEQKQHLAEEFEQWKGELEQIDDVLVAGLRFLAV